MARNQNNQRKASNDRNNSAGRKAAKNNGRGESQKANGGSGRPAGTLIAIGGAEDKEDTKIILSQIAERIGSGKLVISTLAPGYADEAWDIYRKLFTSGDRFDIHSRHPAHARTDVESSDVESQHLKGAASSEVARL